MNLGLKKNEIRLVPYTHEWNNEFMRVKDEIQKYSNIKENQIQHIGSTAIKDSLSKPIIDIMIGLDNLEKLDSMFIEILKSIGFLRLKVERPSEIIFAKFTDNTYEKKTHYIHLVEYEKEIWRKLTFFRDYLNDNKKARIDYMNIKLEYLKTDSIGINEYTDYKESFVKDILKNMNK